MRVTDIFFAFPPLILAMAIAGALGPSLTNALIAVAVVLWPEGSVRPPSPPGAEVRTMATVEVSAVQVRSLDVSGEFDRLLNEISRSEAEIDELAEHIRLRQVSDQVEMLLNWVSNPVYPVHPVQILLNV